VRNCKRPHSLPDGSSLISSDSGSAVISRIDVLTGINHREQGEVDTPKFGLGALMQIVFLSPQILP